MKISHKFRSFNVYRNFPREHFFFLLFIYILFIKKQELKKIFSLSLAKKPIKINLLYQFITISSLYMESHLSVD